MAVVDSQGRLFGKVSLLDIGAALVILLVVFGIFVYPGASGSVAQSNTTTKPVEVEVVVRVATQNVDSLLKPGEKTSIIIRNQPYGEVKIKSVKELPDTVSVPLDNGTVKATPDPRPEVALSRNMIVILEGNAQITKNGPVLGNNKIKIGTPIELEGFKYNFTNLNVRDIRILDDQKA
ncbi:MAG: DUF4330 domain-containing protein [Leptolyngbyaceae cyanobacterium bins.349]|nr:DUF4330 domain-containing protein [Leptolyngbyaceae cyanobacterium bins.349]